MFYREAGDPEKPSFGQTDAPVKPFYEYTFDNLAKTVDKFTELIGLEHFSMYIFDYGAPVGMRIASGTLSFIPADAEVKYVDSGHFAPESHHAEIAAMIKEFLKKFPLPSYNKE